MYTRTQNHFNKMKKEVGMLLQKSTDTRGVGISSMRKSIYLLKTTPSSHTHRFHPLPLATPTSCSPHPLTTPTSHTHTFHPLSTIVIHTFNLCKVQSLDDNCGEWVECMGVASGCGEQEVNLPWLTKEIIQLIRKRNYLFRKAHRSGNIEDHLKFRHTRNRVVAELRSAKRRFLTNLHPHNQQEFWKVVKSLTPKENSIPTLSSGNIVATTNLEKACLLNVTFTNCLNHSLPELNVADLPEAVPHECPDNLMCTEDEVYELLCSLDPTKANGHDDISTRMLKETALSITPAVTQLFNISIRLGELPEEWKIARVTPIPKSHDHSVPGNYRPISLLSVLSKLLEMHIRNLLIDHLKNHYPLSAHQWGFTQGKSTTGALLDTTDQWHRQLDLGLDICCVFFDYSKAFDSVPHRPLLQKLKNCNVHPHILRWITHYLCKRSQYVCVNGSSSGVLPVTSGVPQGSVLGPFLFIFYIDDITMVPLSDGTMSLYADDLVLYRPIHSATDYHLLQIDIDNICVWSDDNLLKFNGRKCKYMIITRRKQPSLPVTPLKIKQTFLERVHSYRYLGVWLTSSLNWSKQVSEVCKKARQQVGILYRKFYPFANSSSLLQLYLAYIRPHLEYATPVWDPHQRGLISSLERVQKFALKVCTKNWSSGYESLLQSCNLPTLASRRCYLKLCLLYKVVNGQLTFPVAPIVLRSQARLLRNTSTLALERPVTRSNAYQSSFFPRTIALWNSLPPSVQNCQSLHSFKQTVLCHTFNTSPIPII